MSGSGSSLRSVIGDDPEDWAAWTSKIVRTDRPPALLHRKFWGRNMEDEEHSWHLVSDPTAPAGEGGGKESTNRDAGEDEEDDVTIIPGCYVLHMDIPGIEFESIWIRSEYICIYDYLEKLYAKGTSVGGKSPAAVLTGQPGIGKSVWVLYALRRRLAERKPVIWYYQGTCYLFVDEGVYAAPVDFPPGCFQTVVWTLVDSDESKDGVPPHLVPHGTRLFVIYVSSPAREQWAPMERTVLPSVIVMNPWTKNEIRRAAPLRFSSPDFQLIDDTYDRLGPTPRICFDKASSPRALQSYQREVDRALKRLTLQTFEGVVHGYEDFRCTMDSLSHKICLLRRADPVEVESADIHLSPITDYVKSKLAIQFRNVERQEQIQLYESLSAVPSTRALSGSIFEAFCQQRFQKRISIKLVPMVRHPGDDQKHKPQWHTSHFVLPNKELERKRRVALRNIISLKASPSDTCRYRDDDLDGLELRSDVYYVPRMTNELALDSFIVHDGYLFIFQFTGSNAHTIKGGLIPLLAKCAQVPPPNNWRLIIIIPEDIEVFKCSVPPQITESHELKLFSSMIAIVAPQLKIPGYSEVY